MTPTSSVKVMGVPMPPLTRQQESDHPSFAVDEADSDGGTLSALPIPEGIRAQARQYVTVQDLAAFVFDGFARLKLSREKDRKVATERTANNASDHSIINSSILDVKTSLVEIRSEMPSKRRWELWGGLMAAILMAAGGLFTLLTLREQRVLKELERAPPAVHLPVPIPSPSASR